MKYTFAPLVTLKNYPCPLTTLSHTIPLINMSANFLMGAMVVLVAATSNIAFAFLLVNIIKSYGICFDRSFERIFLSQRRREVPHLFLYLVV